MKINAQLINTLKPAFSDQEIEQIKLYFQVSEQHTQQLNLWFQEQLKNHPVFGPFLAQQTPKMLLQRNQLSQSLIEKAIYSNQWEPYIKDLITQGAMYAQLGVTFNDWYQVMAQVKDFMLPHIVTFYKENNTKTIDAIMGLNKLTDFGMQCIIEAYFIEKRNKTNLLAKKQTALIKELENFAYVVSHDLKSPLRGIAKISEWLEIDYATKLDDTGKQQLKMLRTRVNRLDNLINGILDYSRLGRTKTLAKPINLNALLKEIIELNANYRSVKVTVAPNLPTLTFVRPKLVQLFSNLINNAIKYNDKRTIRIHIGFEEQEDEYVFWVKDNGPGIAPEYQEKIFGIFQTLQPKDEVESTGIGLSIVQKIIHDADGDIWVSSEVGKSTTFTFTIPK